ncbi:aminoglycoside phosphotransferase family protein [Entomomonas asaccharolytica]|uniref:Aminoglycoside phosphotransferase family protein n=1 Tax=Entomomonas asaccharolytica TaxID=2785331 RepID=A0A974ND54_9GAMM|nr:aminoglycoside phosphotransferase family protein [Entomomonas asaccharolytica]QQP84323.1 aminoglycoside phosphotransferase family protein [Entomomonas asaccharolytica]
MTNLNVFNDVLLNEYKITPNIIVEEKGGWASLAYKVVTVDNNYFLKVYEKKRASTEKLTQYLDDYLSIVMWLGKNALAGQIVEPILTRDLAYKYEDENYIYVLFNYITGNVVADNDLATLQVKQLAQIVANLHSYNEQIPFAISHLKEQFELPFNMQLIYFLKQQLACCSNDIKEVLSPFVAEIVKQINYIEQLAKRLQQQKLAFVLCHTDIHGWNIMQVDNHLILLDWEGLKLAPAEADLFMFYNKAFFKDFINYYQQLHPNFKINQTVMLFYRCRRSLEDLWELIEQLVIDNVTGKLRADTLHLLAKECDTIQVNNKLFIDA